MKRERAKGRMQEGRERRGRQEKEAGMGEQN